MTAKFAKTPLMMSRKTFEQIPENHPVTPLLDKIDSPNDVKKLSQKQLPALADELREFLLYSAGVSGGHFGSNLGVIELTIALHYIYHTPHDQIVWDVGHQAYPHKILTGRRDKISTIRGDGGLTAFPERGESHYDTFGVGHSSTAISAGLGMALALRYQGKNDKVVAVVGDGAMTGGMAFEAMNDAVQQNANICVVLNDNDMSISNATGGFSKHLAVLWQRGLAVDIDKFGNPILTKRTISSEDRRIRHYLHMANEAISDWSVRVPNKIGEKLAEKFSLGEFPPTPSQLEALPEKIALKIADDIFPDNLFKAIGFNYFGPFDGHDVVKLAQVFERVKKLDGAVLVHIHTTKGKGFLPAEADPIGYHAITKILKESQQATKNLMAETQPITEPLAKPKKYSQVFGEWLCDTAKIDKNLIAITPAMAEGSGMVEFAKQFPKQFFDVAIAEQHAVTLAGGMATQGIKPVVAIYSTFLQRGYDQLIHDIALQNLPMLFAIDRAGLVGEDGATHAGVFDIAFMRCVPNMVIATPKDENECYNLLKTCYAHHGVTAVRYPRGNGTGAVIDKTADNYPLGKAMLEQVLTANTENLAKKIALLAFGSMVNTATQASKILNKKFPEYQIAVYNMRFVKPLDIELLDKLLNENQTLITLEEHQIMGGGGSAVNEYVMANLGQSTQAFNGVLNLGIADEFIAHGSPNAQLQRCGLDVEGVVNSITDFLSK